MGRTATAQHVMAALTLVERSVFLWLAVLIVLALLGVSFDV